MRRLFSRLRRTRPGSEALEGLPEGVRPAMLYAFDGFLNAGSAPRIAVEHLESRDEGEVLHEFDLDDYFDYRARRPPMVFDRDRYTDYDRPSLELRLHHDDHGAPFLVLTGPEPDFRWEQFAEEVHELIEEYGVELVVGLGAIPMGVPHTRPSVITNHASRRELLDRPNLFRAQVVVPASIQSVLELRLGEWGHDAIGYVAHVPQYVAQVEYPSASVALLEAVISGTGLTFDLEELRLQQAEAVADIHKQVEEQDGGDVLAGLERQYDQMNRSAVEPLVADESELPTGDEIGEQFEEFLAQLDRPESSSGE
ncbi:PAC2 family protein [Mumia sp.]|uniref:PAC2 family protein n=1 Tax=Mumia sp. TaxID=1965300 RepID=UPI002620E851|nr:PAC2 family protein [Mumia sp.]MDD9350532.1 PAC2 family protein [Mumia sp.]